MVAEPAGTLVAFLSETDQWLYCSAGGFLPSSQNARTRCSERPVRPIPRRSRGRAATLLFTILETVGTPCVSALGQVCASHSGNGARLPRRESRKHGALFVSSIDMRVRLALRVVFFGLPFGCGGSSYSPGPSPTPSPSPPTPGTAVSIVMGASIVTTTAYATNPVSAAVGGTVTSTNNDSTTHTSTSHGGAWSAGSLAPGGTFSRTFPAAGTFSYHCAIHPGMVGALNVQ